MSRNLALLLLLLAVGASLPSRAEENDNSLFVAPENQTDEDLTPLVNKDKKSAKKPDAKAQAPRAAVIQNEFPAPKPAPKAAVIESTPAPAPVAPPPAVAAPVEKPAPVEKVQPESKPAPAVVAEPKKTEPVRPAVVAEEKKPEPAKPVVPAAPAESAKPVAPAVVAKEVQPEPAKPQPAVPAAPAATAEKKPEPAVQPEPKKPEPAVAAEPKKPEPAVVAEPAKPAAAVAADKNAPDAQPANAAAPEKEVVTVSLSAAELATLAENERKLLEMIQQSYSGKDGTGRAYFKSRKPQTIFAGQAIVKGLERNLFIQRQEKQEDIARAARMEARAVFDPIFTVSFTHSMFTQNARSEKVSKFRRPAVQDLRGRLQDPNFIPANTDRVGVTDIADTSVPKIPIKELIYDRIIPPGQKTLVGPEKGIASDKNPNGPVQTEVPSFRIDQQLPWGPAVFISASSRRSESFFDDGFDAATNLQLTLAKQTVRERLEAEVRARQGNENLTEQEITDIVDEELPARLRADPAVRQYQIAFDRSTRRGQGTSRPWSSSFVGGFATPVPGTKDWGPYSRADLGIKLANLDKERAYWDTKTVVNQTLRDIDFAYWDLVGTIEQLRAVTENRKLLDGLAGELRKQLDAGRTTQYGVIQIEAQQASVREQEETAWANFAQASNFLNTLLNEEQDTLFLPAGYTKALTEQLKWRPEEAMVIAKENRPELKAAQVGGKVSELLVQFQKNQVKPDLKYGFTFSVSQSSRPFGFKTWQQSLAGMFGNGKEGAHLVNVPVKGVGTPSNLTQIKQVYKKDDNAGPDTRQHSHTLAYNWPLGNRGLKAALRESEISRDQQDIAIDLTENGIEQDVGNAVVNLLSAKESYDIAVENYRLASSAYDDASGLLNAGRLTEFEIVSRSRDLLFADLARITASINLKKAETQLLQSQGVLPNAFATLRSMTDLDQQRLSTLKERKALRFFTPVKVETEPLDTGSSTKEQAASDGAPVTASADASGVARTEESKSSGGK
ncbi:MAG TPA: TolC family protein [Planctomycetota bacterium]|nr:TolC family protein [Planctomycetota bacterium]